MNIWRSWRTMRRWHLRNSKVKNRNYVSFWDRKNEKNKYECARKWWDTSKQLRISEQVLLFGNRPGQILANTDVKLIDQGTPVQSLKPATQLTQEIWTSNQTKNKTWLSLITVYFLHDDRLQDSYVTLFGFLYLKVFKKTSCICIWQWLCEDTAACFRC